MAVSLLVGLALLGTSAAVEQSYGRLGAIDRHIEVCKRVEEQSRFYKMLDEHLVYNREIEDEYLSKLKYNMEFTTDLNRLYDGIPKEEKSWHTGQINWLLPRSTTKERVQFTIYERTHAYMNSLGYDSYHYFHHPEFYKLCKRIHQDSDYTRYFPAKKIEEMTWEEVEIVLYYYWDRVRFFDLYTEDCERRGFGAWKSEKYYKQLQEYEVIFENRRLKQERIRMEREQQQREFKEAQNKILTGRAGRVASQKTLFGKIKAWLGDPCV